MKVNATKFITRAGIISALYILLSLLTFGLNGGAVQLRVAEGLTLLPLLLSEAVPALFIGCILTNLISGLALLDVFLGAVITLLSAVLTFLMGKVIKNTVLKVVFGGIFPVLLNAFILPLIWKYCYNIEYMYILQVAFLLVSQSVSVYLMGTPIYLGAKKILNNISLYKK